MIAPPDFRAVDGFLARAATQRARRGVAYGAAIGFAAAIVLTLILRAAASGSASSVNWMIASGGALIAAAGAALGFARSRIERRRIAYAVEQRAPRCRNLVITAAELPRESTEGAYASSIVAIQAANALRELDPATLFPIRLPVVTALLAALLWTMVIIRPAVAPIALNARRGAAVGQSGGIARVDIAVIPPSYTGRRSTTLRDPSTIDALAGSHIRIDVRANAPRIVVETATTLDTISQPNRNGAFALELRAEQSGFISIAPLATDGAPAPRRLIGLTVHADAPPRVRITSPAHDVVLRSRQTTLEITADAADDFGITSLLLKYTKVSGADERYTFVDGVVPATIARRDPRTWTVRTVWKLDDLHLQPGDMVVYRAVATDNQPGAEPVESDAFIAELPDVGSDAAAGFSIDPEKDRAAVRQQMVILKTERLLAARPSIAADSFADRARDLAAEQRKVRAEFVFMLGGEIADAADAGSSMTTLNETAEAEGESDLAAGRNENAGHAALLVAIRAMSQAAAALTSIQVDTALGHERTALTQLERAFSHSRIILRALAAPERLDLSRRLSGSLADAAGERRAAARALPPPAVAELQSAMADIATLAAHTRIEAGDAERALAIGDRLLRVDPTADTLRAAAAALSSAAARLASRPAAARDDLSVAATAIATLLRRDTPKGTSAVQSSPELRRVQGTLADVLRGRAP